MPPWSWNGGWGAEAWWPPSWQTGPWYPSQWERGAAWWDGDQGEAKGKRPEFGNTTTLGGPWKHALKREYRLKMLQMIVRDSLPTNCSLPLATTAQWGTTTLDAVFFLLTRCSPKTPIKSLAPDGQFDLETGAAQLNQAMTSLHQPAQLQDMLCYLCKNCNDQVGLIQYAIDEGFDVPEEDFEKPKSLRGDHRSPPDTGISTLGLQANAKGPGGRTIKRENTDEELARVEKTAQDRSRETRGAEGAAGSGPP